MKRVLSIAVALALAVAVAVLPDAAVAKPDPPKRNAKLLADWWDALLSLPADINPLLGNGDFCLQVKGNIVSPTPPPGQPNITCQLKHGQKLLLQALTTECSNVEPPPFFGADYAAQLACARASDAGVSAPVLTFDGQVVPNFEVVTSPQKITLPDGNVFTGTRQKATFAAHGWNALVETLRRGTHTAQMHQENLPPPFDQDIYITVIVR